MKIKASRQGKNGIAVYFHAHEKFSGFNIPQHAATAEDVKLIEAEGSFSLRKLKDLLQNAMLKPKMQRIISEKATFVAGTYT
ncbi:hypothetical protein Ancab_027413 [Ancistrocladus abbreviatus]